jgi:hypothetical protein
MYAATITDAAGQQVMLSAQITQPSALTTNLIPGHPSCHNTTDGSIAINGSGGTPPYAYFLNGNPTTSPITDLGPGVHDVSVVDANGCMVEVTVTLESPEAVLIELIDIVHQTTQMGGAIVIELSGGTTPYDFFWEGPDDYTNTIQNPFNLIAGTYTLTVTDGNGCTETFTAEVNFASGIRDLSQGYTVQLSPNPGANLLRIQLPADLKDTWELRCIDTQGRLIDSRMISGDADDRAEILQDWNPGLYVITLFGKSSGVILTAKWLRLAD